MVNWPRSGTFVPLLGTCTLCQSEKKCQKVAHLCHFWDLVHCGNLAKKWKVWWPKIVKKWHVCSAFGNLRTVSRWQKSGTLVPHLGTCTLCESGLKVTKSGTFVPLLGICALCQSCQKVARLCHFLELVHFVKVAKKCQKVAHLCQFWDLVFYGNLNI